jgi:nucleoside-diphosphate-sugar epimerase
VELGVETVRGDLCDSQVATRACQGIETVFHAAGKAGIWGPWNDYFATNTLATRHVIAACRASGVERLVYTSSPSVTFDGRDQSGIDESAPYPARWLCHYPHTKALAEQEVLAAAGKDGLATCALRPHLIWGPRDQHLVPRLLARAARGQLRRVGSGKNLIDTIYVENAAAAHLQAADALALDSPVCGRAYFLSQGEPVNCWEWIDRLLALADLPPVKKSISFRAAWALGAALEGVHAALFFKSEPRMTRFLAAQLAKDHYFDLTRAKEDFGYRPRVTTEEGMTRLAEVIRSQCETACS